MSPITITIQPGDDDKDEMPRQHPLKKKAMSVLHKRASEAQEAKDGKAKDKKPKPKGKDY